MMLTTGYSRLYTCFLSIGVALGLIISGYTSSLGSLTLEPKLDLLTRQLCCFQPDNYKS